MSQYDTLDRLIVKALRKTPMNFTALWSEDDVEGDILRLARLLGRDDARILDGRLQALKKRGLIYYDGRVWRTA